MYVIADLNAQDGIKLVTEVLKFLVSLFSPCSRLI